VSNSLPAFGFLTVVEDSQHGFFGGYLVLSELGRPLEFHCSTPVLPSQAQKILYGSTLRSYVLGELIGPVLVEKAQLPVLAVLTDLEEMLSLGLVWPGVMAWVGSETSGNDGVDLGAQSPPTEAASSSRSGPEPEPGPVLDLGGYCLAGSSTCCWGAEELRGTLATLVSYVDLAEPFERIREAIQEAQRVTEHPAEETDEHSAAA